MKTLKVKSILFSLLAVMAVAVFMTSCEQESIIKEEINEWETSSLITEFPDVNNDVLQFKDIEQFRTVYEKLNKLYDEDDQKFNEVMEALNVNSVYNRLSNDVFADPKDRYQPFLANPVMMSLVNENFEFQISKVLHTCVTNSIILTSDIKDTETRNKIRAIEKGTISSHTIPAKAYPINYDDFALLLGPWENEDYDITKIVFDASKGATCTIDGATSWDWKQNANATEAISYRAASYKNWGRTFEEAKVYSYSKQNGQWRSTNGTIFARVFAERTDSSCQWDNRENERKDCSSCSNKRARVNKSGDQYHLSGLGVSANYGKNNNLYGSHAINY